MRVPTICRASLPRTGSNPFDSARFSSAAKPRSPAPKSRKKLRQTISLTVVAFAASATALGFVYTDEVEWGASATVRGGRIIAASLHIALDYKWSLRKSVLEKLKALDDADRKDDDDDDDGRIEKLWSEVHRRNAERLLHVFMENGGVYIKLGQHLNALVYLLPVEYTSTFRVCQDSCSPTPLKELQELIKVETGKEMNEIFEEFDETPIGVASL
ncbi:hypothetical protein HK100_010916, partial [Physocladia obscura]